MAKVVITQDRCKSCGYCVQFCPRHVLEIGKEVNDKGYAYAYAVRPEDCIGCAMCAQMCPDIAIEVYR